jgi:hypothetical protein
MQEEKVDPVVVVVVVAPKPAVEMATTTGSLGQTSVLLT